MARKTRTTTVVKTEEEQTKNPVYKLLKNFFETGEYDEELDQYNTDIEVWIYSKDNVPAKVTNRKFSDLTTLHDDLGAMFGDARFKLMVKVFDDEGKKISFYKCDDVRTIVGPDDGPEDPEPEQGGQSQAMLTLQVEKMRLESAERIKAMELQAETYKAIAAIKGGGNGGMNPGSYLNLIKQGMRLAGGNVPEDDGDGAEPASMMEQFIGPFAEGIGRAIGDALQNKILPGASAPAPVSIPEQNNNSAPS